jgi:hypothetical protein
LTLTGVKEAPVGQCPG